MNLAFSPWQRADIIRHSLRLHHSFQYWTGAGLCSSAKTPQAIAHALFHASFVLLSHGTEADPILNYGNQQTLQLWEISWQDLTQMPSRLTAEPKIRQERAQLLHQATQQGYIRDYQGIRKRPWGRGMVPSFKARSNGFWSLSKIVIDNEQLCRGH